MGTKTVRANLSDLEHRQFTTIAASRGLRPTKLVEQLCKGFLVEQLRINPAIRVGIVEGAERTATKEITTRQFAKLKKLQELVPNCSVNNSTDRVLTYPVAYESIVLEFLASCPKGSRKERRAEREVPVFKKMNPTEKPGLKAARKERATYESKHVRITAEAETILEEGPHSLDELFNVLKTRKQEVPGGKDPKYILKTLLGKSDRIVYDRPSKKYSLRVEEEELDDSNDDEAPPTAQAAATVSESVQDIVEAPPVSEPNVELTSRQSETVSPKVPAFFPRWAEG